MTPESLEKRGRSLQVCSPTPVITSLTACCSIRTLSDAVVLVVLLLNLAVHQLLSSRHVHCTARDVITQRLHVTGTQLHSHTPLSSHTVHDISFLKHTTSSPINLYCLITDGGFFMLSCFYARPM